MKPLNHSYFRQYTEAAPLAVFRILFGTMMLISMLRFWGNGWIDKLYIQPTFFFSYYGFEWIKPLGVYTYGLFLVCGLASLFIAIGYKYRIATVVFFLSFTYIELMDKTTYLNHYYFVSLIAFLLILLPANAYCSVDAQKNPAIRADLIPKWTVDAVKLMLGTVYFFAGLAKLNSDWLIHAMPLSIWLPSNDDLPILGGLMHETWIHYVFSWAGALFDLSVPFLLFYRRTRLLAFALLVVFHLLTRALFPIGMFPYIMIVSALIFFDPKWHQRILMFFSRRIGIKKVATDDQQVQMSANTFGQKLRLVVLVAFFALQWLVPFRYWLYPDELFWTEEGFRFSWRVMLMEKAGNASFRLVDNTTGKQFYIDNTKFLTPFQEKQMSFQPDFILEYAYHLGRYYKNEGKTDISIYVDCYVALNGRMSQPYIDPQVDLLTKTDSFVHKDWILPFRDEIKGI